MKFSVMLESEVAPSVLQVHNHEIWTVKTESTFTGSLKGCCFSKYLEHTVKFFCKQVSVIGPDLQGAELLWLLQFSVLPTVFVFTAADLCVSLHMYMHAYTWANLQARTHCVVCVCLQVTVLPAGNSWLRCFEVRLLLFDKQRAEQVLELADSFVQRVLFALIAVLKDHPLKRIDIIHNKVELNSNICPCVLCIYLLTIALCWHHIHLNYTK